MENGAACGGGGDGVNRLVTSAAGGGGGGNGSVLFGGYGLGEAMHTTNESIMMGRHFRHDGFDGGDGGGGNNGGGVGPTCGANKKNIFMYGDDVAAAAHPHTSTIPPFTGAAAGGPVVVRISQPFHCSSNSPLPFKCPPSMATSLGFPFTWIQWKELERQAMVYKYMMASMPVPPDLLLPISSDTYGAAQTTSHFHTQSGSSGGVHGLGISGKNRDLEPGRCKRTDGKKWRCAKEVALNQKYCERHLHRGRPRSRKPVEDHQNLLTTNNSSNSKKTTRLQPSAPLESTSSSMVISQSAATGSSSSHLLVSSSDKRNKFSISPFEEPHRSLDWGVEREMLGMAGAEEQWQPLMAFESSVYRENTPIFQPMNLFDCKELDGNQYLNPELGSLDKEFINAWSNGNFTTNSTNNITNTDSSLSLSMAMAAGNILDSEMGLLETNCHDEYNKCSNLTWQSPVSWVPFALGGPLAEVLKPSQHHHHSLSYISNGGDSISPAGTTVSSPSGVLQKTALFSQSDSSVCNSPTLAGAELAPFQWPV